jgi:F-type H+-transporting ATPase subunit epsilon
MTIRCEIVTQERTVFSDDVDSVNLPGIEGRMGILANHSPLLTVLDFGEIYVKKDGEVQFFAVGGGFAEIQPQKVIVLADSAERADEIDVNRAQEARDRAHKLMEEGVPEDPARYEQIEASLRRAQIRIDISRKRARRRQDVPHFGGDEE